MSAKQRNATIKQVAQAAGVSTASVSRVMNNLGGISPETRAHIQEIAARMGYTPSRIAQTMKTGKTMTIGLVLPELSSMFSTRLLEGIEAEAIRGGRTVIVAHTHSRHELTMDALRVLTADRVDGIIFASDRIRRGYIEIVARYGIPLVLIATRDDKRRVPSISVDDHEACRYGVAKLIEMGHRKIGMIAGSLDAPIAGRPRVEGYRTAMSEAGLPIPTHYILDAGGFKFEDLRGFTLKLRRCVARSPPYFALPMSWPRRS